MTDRCEQFESRANVGTGDSVVQRKSRNREARLESMAGGVQSVAAAGTSGGGGSLPHLDRIQAAFGSHDVSGVQSHVGGAAAAASDQLGAQAYASGNHVAFKESPSLHTAAHEAAHVVQQRGGVQLKSGLDSPGDSYERHADAVADAVVAGTSAEGLLSGAPSQSGGCGIQRKRNDAEDEDPYEQADREYEDGQPHGGDQPAVCDPGYALNPDDMSCNPWANESGPPRPGQKQRSPTRVPPLPGRPHPPKQESKTPTPEPLSPVPPKGPTLDNVPVRPEDTDTDVPDKSPSGPGFFVELKWEEKLGERSYKYATVEGTVGLGVKGSFIPKDANPNLAVGWQNGLKGEVSTKWKMGGEKARGFEVKEITPKGIVRIPIANRVDGGLGQDQGKAGETWLEVSAELEILCANGTFSKVELGLLKVKRGKTPEVLSVGITPAGFKLKDSISVDVPVPGKLEGQFSGAPKMTIKPNWPAIMAELAKDSLVTTEGTIVLNSIGLLEIGAIAAPVAFAVLAGLAIWDLNDAITKAETLGNRFHEAMDAFRAGLKAGLVNGRSGGGHGAGDKGFAEGQARREAGFKAFKEHAEVKAWIAAQTEKGRSEADIEKELRQVYEQKLAESADQIVRRATAQFDGSLRKQLLKEYLDRHGDDDEWFAKPGLCYRVFKDLYPEGDKKPWTVPKDVYERVRATVKGHMYLAPWQEKPREQAPKEQSPEERHKMQHSGLSDNLVQWVRRYLWVDHANEAPDDWRVIAAYEREHGVELDSGAKETIRNLCGAAMRDAMRGFTRSSEGQRSEEEVPKVSAAEAQRELGVVRGAIGKARVKAGQAYSAASSLKTAKARAAVEHGMTFLTKANTMNGEFEKMPGATDKRIEFGWGTVQAFANAERAFDEGSGRAA